MPVTVKNISLWRREVENRFGRSRIRLSQLQRREQTWIC
jgi:hypothetical protein